MGVLRKGEAHGRRNAHDSVRAVLPILPPVRPPTAPLVVLLICHSGAQIAETTAGLLEATTRRKGLAQMRCLRPPSSAPPVGVPLAVQTKGAAVRVAITVAVVAREGGATLQTERPVYVLPLLGAGSRLQPETTRRVV